MKRKICLGNVGKDGFLKSLATTFFPFKFYSLCQPYSFAFVFLPYSLTFF